jgi:hypothetical protein
MTLGTTTLTLKRTPPDHYIYQLSTQTRGLARLFVKDTILETSSGRIRASSVLPSRYVYIQTGGSKESMISAQIESDTQRAIITGSEGNFDLELQAGTVDRLAVHLAMMLYLQNNSLPAQFHLLDKTRLKEYTLVETGSETLKTPVGTFSTLIITRDEESGGRKTQMWVAPQLNYLPLRIRQDKNGSREFEMNLTQLEGFSLSPTPRKKLITPEMIP